MGKYQFAMASEWMENGNINEFIGAHRDANRLELVRLTPASGCVHVAYNASDSSKMSPRG